jgi:hypothetical protein
MLSELEQAQIISRDSDSIRFKYKACYCYFVAKYFQENLAVDKQGLTKTTLEEIADRVYYEDYANIVIFFIFLTKDPDVIKQIVDNANKIYSELPPCNFMSDVAFVNALLKETPKKLMQVSNPVDNRAEYRRQQDHDSDEIKVDTQSVGDKIEYDSALADLQKVNIAFRNLRILGHVLRNFTGVLRKDLKRQLADASYGLALRVGKRVFLMIEDNAEEFRLQLAEVIKQRRAAEAKDEYDLVSEDELNRAADEALITIARAVGFGLIKRLSMNLGSEDLVLTYQGIRGDSGEDNAAVRLIDLAIRLDHFREAPKQDIDDLARMLKKNFYSFTLLQDLVAEYLYLNVSDQRDLQKIGALVGINPTGKPEFLLHKKKALRA